VYGGFDPDNNITGLTQSRIFSTPGEAGRGSGSKRARTELKYKSSTSFLFNGGSFGTTHHVVEY